MITVAKQIPNKNKTSEADIIHFYGDYAFNTNEEFLKLLTGKSYTHPLNILISFGFVPVGDQTWMKKY